ncbi:Uncharacterised protein [Candidatus Gugararchaeum adminiculabundum]|nr:Uncharacterised protein [Candidatus Gugararchaeum adminiculabundum]
MVSILVVAISFMASRIFQSPHLEAFAKVEFREAVISILLVSLLASLIVPLADNFGSLFYEQYAAQIPTAMGAPVSQSATVFGSTVEVRNYFKMAYAYLDESSDYMARMYLRLLEAEKILVKYTTFSYNIATPGWYVAGIFSMSPSGGISLVSIGVSQGVNALSNGVAFNTAEKLFLKIFEYNAFRFLLPLGILMRAFSITRKLGSTIIAIAIGMYIVFPLTVVLAGNIYYSVPRIDPSAVALPKDLPPPPKYMCDQTMQFMISLGQWLWTLIKCIPQCAGPHFWICFWGCHAGVMVWFNWLSMGFLIAAVPTLIAYANISVSQVYWPLANSVLPAVARISAITFILPILSIFITVTSITNISKMIGGDTNIIGLFKIV